MHPRVSGSVDVLAAAVTGIKCFPGAYPDILKESPERPCRRFQCTVILSGYGIIHEIGNTKGFQLAAEREIRCEFHSSLPYLPVINREEAFEKVRNLVSGWCGKEAFHELSGHTMSSEDFSWYLRRYPGIFCHLGAGPSAQLHSPQFDFDDRLLSAGIRYFCVLALGLFRS